MSTTASAVVYKRSVSKGSARLVLLAMADEANDEGMLTAYARSQSHLARKANISPSSCTRAIAALIELGEVVLLAKGDGRASSNYRIVLPGLGEGCQSDTPQIDTPGVANRHPRGSRMTPQGGQSDTPIIPFSPVDPVDTPTTSRDRATVELADGFDAFWALYPRKDAKGTARKAWPAAVKAAGSMTVVFDGARRYRDDPNRDPGFTAHAATWLRAERWADGPLPPRAGGRPAGPGPRAPIDTNRDEPGGVLDL